MLLFIWDGDVHISLKDFIPVGVAAFVFIGNVVYQERNRKTIVRDRLKGEVLSTCDKMMKYAIEAEYSAIAWRYWNKSLPFFRPAVPDDYDKEANKAASTEVVYYHRKLEDAGLKLDLLKSELRKTVTDLKIYWPDEVRVHEIIELMHKAIIETTRRYDSAFDKEYSSRAELQEDYNSLINEVEKEIVFEGLGFALIRIQKIIDPESPIMHVPHELENELSEKVKEAETLWLANWRKNNNWG
ncbi:MAG: hypothetical protein ACJ77K_03300 [Bacteroidia bacterium]|jgi:hypothetical protein